MATIQNVTDHLNKLLPNSERRRKQEKTFFKGFHKEGKILLFRNVPDGFHQRHPRPLDALEMERFLILARDIMEHVGRSCNVLLCIMQR
jgi:hypothetical protein